MKRNKFTEQQTAYALKRLSSTRRDVVVFLEMVPGRRTAALRFAVVVITTIFAVFIELLFHDWPMWAGLGNVLVVIFVKCALLTVAFMVICPIVGKYIRQVQRKQIAA